MQSAKNPHIQLAASAPDELFHAFFNASPDALMAVDEAGAIRYFNESFGQLYGKNKNDIQSLYLSSASHHRFKAFSKEVFQNDGFYEDVQVEGSRDRVFDISVRSTQLGSELWKLVSLKDVTEKKQLEADLLQKHRKLSEAYEELKNIHAELKLAQESLVQAGKLAALGELSAGIGHELNQPLMAIQGYAQEVEHWLKKNSSSSSVDPQSAHQFVQEILVNTKRMQTIIRGVRNFIGQSTEGFEQACLKDIVNEAYKLVSHDLQRFQIQTQVEISDSLQIYCNVVQLEQVLINLFTNARDAIQSKGLDSQGRIQITANSDQDFVQLVFEDNGVGMDASTQEKMFNPFFTTKEVGAGMGLGMSLSHGIIQSIHGSMAVKSELGKGTQFFVRIPMDFRTLKEQKGTTV